MNETSAAHHPELRRYLANLERLYRCDPSLAAKIDALPFADCPSFETARDGRATAQVRSDDGKSIYLHSRHRPLEEAQTYVAAQIAARVPGALAAEPDDSEESDRAVVVLAGIGLGHHITPIEGALSRPAIVVIEPDPALIKAAFCLHDFSELLDGGRLVFITEADKAQIHEKLWPFHAMLMLGTRFVQLPYVARRHVAFHERARAMLLDFLAYARTQFVTLLRNSRITFENVAFNLPAYLANAGVEALKDRAHGYPAILVAAGPSLARNVEQLAAVKDRAVIIAVQTVLKPLLERGIRPHFVTSLDYHEISRQFFIGADGLEDTILVAEPKVAWQVPDAYTGRMHLLHSRIADDLLRETAPPRAKLRAGSTVAHLAFYLAEHLGCDPIILIGQDLAFSEGMYYAPGTPVEQQWRPELGRFQTIEMKQWERIIRVRPILRTVPDIHGRSTYTDEPMYTYGEQFEADFARTHATVINASEGGRRLAGTRIVSLREAASQFCARKLPEALFDRPTGGDAPRAFEPAITALEARRDEVAALKKIAQELSMLLARLSKLLDRPDEFNRVLAKVDELRLQVLRYDRTYQIVISVSQVAELRRLRADRRIGEEEADVESPETARQRLSRDRAFVSEFLDGCAFLESLLPAAIARLREARA